MSSKSRYAPMGYDMNQMSIEVLQLDCDEALESSRQLVMACANPHSLAVSQSDLCFANALENAEHLLCDGAGLFWASKLLGVQSGPRITGSDYFTMVMSELAASRHSRTGQSLRVFFFGSSDYVLGRIVERVKEQHNSVQVCGTLSPPYGDWSVELNKEMIEQINAAEPDVVWVGMTAPKQEKWVADNRTLLKAPLIGSIGAVFDFVAETYPRAPEWACRLGLEWLVRLMREPRRMWRRTFISMPLFMFYLAKNRLSNG